MNRKINLRTPARPASSSLDPAEAQWLESVSRALLQHIAFLRQLKQLKPPAAGEPDQVSGDFPVAVVSAPESKRHCRVRHRPCLVTIPRHVTFSLLMSRAANRT
jgi:hypothetical protein